MVHGVDRYIEQLDKSCSDSIFQIQELSEYNFFLESITLTDSDYKEINEKLFEMGAYDS